MDQKGTRTSHRRVLRPSDSDALLEQQRGRAARARPLQVQRRLARHGGGKHELRVEWNTEKYNPEIGVTRYEVYYRRRGDGDYNSAGVTESSYDEKPFTYRHTLRGPDQSKVYEVKVCGVNDIS